MRKTLLALLSLVALAAGGTQSVAVRTSCVYGEPSTKWWLKFTAVQTNSTFKVVAYGNNSPYLEYSRNDGESWTDIIYASAVTLTNIGDYVYIRARRNNTVAPYVFSQATRGGTHFEMTGKIAASGDVTSLLTPKRTLDVINNDFALAHVFKTCTTKLVSAPCLPSHYISPYCYYAMFNGTSITNTVDLPAYTVPNYGYMSMFAGCKKMERAPDLLAASVGKYGYTSMFSACSALRNMPHIASTNVPSYGFVSMFNGCTSLFINDVQPGQEWGIDAEIDDGVTTWGTRMLGSTGGTVTGVPELGRTYYAISTDDCLTLSSTNAFTLATGDGAKHWDGTLWTATNLNSWVEWDGSTVQAAAASDGTYNLYVCGNTNNTVVSEYSTDAMWVLSGSDISCSGNIETLRGATGNDPSPTQMGAYCYRGLFANCTGLTSAPVMPATSLAENCYSYMFFGCTGLRDAPVLPSVVMADSCYAYMFSGCTGLCSPPSLPATALADGCYGNMFFGCTGLTHAPSLPALTMAEECYGGMFSGCTGITTLPPLPSESLAVNCYRYMFSGCTAVTALPYLPASYLPFGCYSYMFSGCTGLHLNQGHPGVPWSIPPSATPVASWGASMLSGTSGDVTQPSSGTTYYIAGIPFDDCLTFSSTNAFTLATSDGAKHWSGTLWTSTNKIDWVEWDGTEVSAAYCSGTNFLYVCGDASNTYITYGYAGRWVLSGGDISCSGNIETLRGATGNDPSPTQMAGWCYSHMFWDCTSLVSAPSLTAVQLNANCYPYMFRGCSRLVSAPELPAKTMYSGSYMSMFYGCSILTNAPALPATTVSKNCYYAMFSGCISLRSSPLLPSLTMADGCYGNMFYGCTGITDAPELPATTLAERCYSDMFYGCTGLKRAPALPATIMKAQCYNEMFSGCTGLTRLPVLPATSLASYCYNRMFADCTGIKVSADRPGTPWVISATDTTGGAYGAGMFAGTGGSFTSKPDLNVTYYVGSDVYDDCLTFAGDDQFTLSTSDGSKHWDGTLWTSTNRIDWVEWDGMSTVTSRYDDAVADYRLYVYGDTNNTVIGAYGKKWLFTGKAIYCSGNIETLRGATGNDPSPTQMGAYCYCSLFSGCTNLVSAPSLPATSLADFCYYSMFSSTAISEAPELPATSLSKYCYCGMFSGCDNLTKSPDLPAKDTARSCYQDMFEYCTRIQPPKRMPATNLAEQCYCYMFNGCDLLSYLPEFPPVSMSSRCCSGMFALCPSLIVNASGPGKPWRMDTETYEPQWSTEMFAYGGSTVEAPVTNTTYYVYSDLPVDYTMSPDNCITLHSEHPFTIKTSDGAKHWNGVLYISTGPVLGGWEIWDGATVHATNDSGKPSYYIRICGTAVNTTISGGSAGKWVMSGSDITCSGNIETLRGAIGNSPSQTQMADNCYNSLFAGCSALVSAPSLTATSLSASCYAGMFSGCSSLLHAPALPATTLKGSCYASMFSDCRSLVTVTVLPATEAATYCYSSMFSGCSSLSSAPVMPIVTTADFCCQYMFSGCTGLVSPPVLPATALSASCYMGMFKGCTGLTVASALPATVLGYRCYSSMFSGCTRLTAPPALPAITLTGECYPHMFDGCTSLVSIPELPATQLTYMCYYYMFYGCKSLKVNSSAPGTEWSIHATSTGSYWGTDMFTGTGGSLTGQPALGTTYYVQSDPASQE